MKRLLLACAMVAALVPAAPAPAQTAVENHVFVAVDAFEVRGSTVKVTGVLEGGSTAETVEAYFSSTETAETGQVLACERLALLAMARPGQFRFELRMYSTFPSCKLTRATP